MTIPVTGNAKGGTTMVAGLLRIMGIFMGYQFGKNSHTCSNEDKAFSALHRKPEELIRLIHHRNKHKNVWGWKHPSLFKDLKDFPQVHEALRNPRFIFVFRDPAATVKRHQQEYGDRDLANNAEQVCEKQMEMIQFIQRYKHQYKFLIFSYEKALTKTEQTIEELADYLGVNLTPETKEACLAYVKPEAGYQPMEEFLRHLEYNY